MKKNTALHSTLITCVALAAGLLLTSLAATAAESKKSPPLNQDGTVKIPAEILLTEIKATPWSGRDALRAKVKEAETTFGYRLIEWNAMKNNLPEKEKEAAALDLKELVKTRELLRQKIDTFEFASEETWNSAKYDLYVTILNGVSIYKKLQYRLDP